MPHFGIKKCAKMGQPDKSYVNCSLASIFSKYEKIICTYKCNILALKDVQKWDNLISLT